MYFGKGVDMKLVRFGKKGSEKPGIIDADGCIRDLSMHLDDLWGENVSKEKLSKLNSIDLKTEIYESKFGSVNPIMGM